MNFFVVFFSRRKIEYKCKGDSTCQVDINRRNQCQACRFQRCLVMKMKPNGENYLHLYANENIAGIIYSSSYLRKKRAF